MQQYDGSRHDVVDDAVVDIIGGIACPVERVDCPLECVSISSISDSLQDGTVIGSERSAEEWFCALAGEVCDDCFGSVELV